MFVKNYQYQSNSARIHILFVVSDTYLEMFKQIFDPSDQCGGQSPLVTLSKNFGRTDSHASSIERTIQAAIPTNEAATLLSQEYLEKITHRIPAQNTFDMRQMVAQLPVEVAHLATNQTMLEQCWQKAQRKILALGWSKQFLQNGGQKWAEEFEQRLKSDEAAKQKTEGEEKQSNFEWMDTKLARGDLFTSTWARDFLERYDSSSSPLSSDGQMLATAETAMAREWEREFLVRIGALEVHDRQSPNGEMSFFDYESAWEAIHSKEAQEKYAFRQENPFVGEHNPTEKAIQTFREGRVADSILHYEAALQSEPDNVQLWHSLGIALAENEDDPRAISALRNALKLDPCHKPSLLALSVSLANESFDHLALHELHKWINSHEGKELPKDNSENTSLYRQYAQLDGAEFARIERLFLTSISSDQIDQAELHNALSVLYNLAGNYDSAIDCVRATLAFRPEDPILWNRLGATLANADRAAEAINAYKRALQLFPAYTRARYNLGVACTNLNSYRDAATHFVTALQLQNSPEDSQIWSKLRSAIIRLVGNDQPSANCFGALERKELNEIVTFLQHKDL